VGTTTSHTHLGRAGTFLEELGDRAVYCDLYDEVGAPVYHDLAGGDVHEVRELLTLLQPLPGPVLDLAAGSGRLTMPLLASGREVTALELSQSMLDLLAARLQGAPDALQRRCTLVQGDMRRFALERKFGAVVLGTTSISLLDTTGRMGLYAAVRDHLAPNGRFLMSTVSIGPSETESVETEFKITGESGRLYRVFEHWHTGAESRTVTVVPAVMDEGPVAVCTTSIRVLTTDQLEAELRRSGFTVRARLPLPDVGVCHHNALLEAEVAP
jgi:SAM-dependent methyltransferase